MGEAPEREFFPEAVGADLDFPTFFAEAPVNREQNLEESGPVEHGAANTSLCA